MFEQDGLMEVGNIKDFVINDSEACMQRHHAAIIT